MDNKTELEYQNRIEFLENQVDYLQTANEELKNSSSWKITKPLRWIMIRCEILRKISRFIRLIKTKGIKKSVQVSKLKIHKKIPADFFDLSEREVEYYHNIQYAKEIKITVLLDHSIGNYPKETLESFKESVKKQFYPKIDLQNINLDNPEENLQITGDYILLASPFVTLKNNMVSELVQTIIEKEPMMIYTDSVQREPSNHVIKDTAFRPDYSLHMLENYNYIGNVFCIKSEIYMKLIKNTKLSESAYYYDLLLQLTEQNGSKNIVHIPQVLYYTKENFVSETEKSLIETEKKEILKKHFERIGKQVKIETGDTTDTLHVKYQLEESPLISLLIPTCDHVEDLQKCINSILDKSTYSNYEIIVIENNSKADKTFRYYEKIQKNSRIKLIYWKGIFNYSAINNFGEKHAKGDYLLLLNNDVEVITPSWMEEMLMYAQQPEIGAVGAKLYFPDDTIQHAGVILGIRGLAGHGHRGFARNADGYMKRLKIVQDYSVVTAACLMVDRKKYQEVQGFEEELAVDFNDVDFCMKLRKYGYENIFTPYAQLYHYESKSRGLNHTKEKMERVEKEYGYFKIKWRKEIIQRDPYYNPNLTLEEDDFSINIDMDRIAL